MNLDDEFMAGYIDGHDLTTPEPSQNRSEAYRHSWTLGRAEKLGQPLPKAAVSRAKAAEIIERENAR